MWVPGLKLQDDCYLRYANFILHWRDGACSTVIIVMVTSRAVVEAAAVQITTQLTVTDATAVEATHALAARLVDWLTAVLTTTAIKMVHALHPQMAFTVAVLTTCWHLARSIAD